MDGNTNGAGATMHIFISYFPLAWSCVRGSSSYFLTLFDPVIFVPCPWPSYCLTPALSFPESPRRNPDFDDKAGIANTWSAMKDERLGTIGGTFAHSSTETRTKRER